MSKLHHVDQGSTEWWSLRRGMPTASQFHRIITPGGKPSAQAREYMYELIAERLLGETMDRKGGGKIAWVEHGMATEGDAISAFQTEHPEFTTEAVSFITSNDGRIGCSPDLMIKGNREGVEIKCPAPWTQIKYLLDGPGTDYKPQVQGQLLITGWKAMHFYSFHPRMPRFYRLTLRDDAFIALLERLLDEFCEMLDAETTRARLLGVYSPAAGHLGAPIEDLPGKFPWKPKSTA